MDAKTQKVQVLGTRRADGRIVNESPSSATVPKVFNAAMGAGAAGVTVQFIILILSRAGIAFDETERSVVSAFLELALTGAGSLVGAWLAGYFTPPAGFTAPDEVTPPAPPPGARKMAFAAALLVPLFLLGGCHTTQGTIVSDLGSMTPELRLTMICRSYDATLRSLAGYRAAGKIGAGGVETVEQLRRVANPPCTSPEPPTGLALRQAIDAIEAELNRALLLEQSVAPPGAMRRGG